MKSDKIYLKPVGGLCNRMRTVDTAVSLAAHLQKQLVVFWGRDIHLNCKFSDLFQPSINFDVVEEKQWLGKKALFPYLPGSKPYTNFRNLLYNFTKATLAIKTEIWFEDFENTVSIESPNTTPWKVKTMKDFDEQSFLKMPSLLKPLHEKGNAFICSAWKLVPGQNYAENFIPIDSLAEIIDEIRCDFRKTIGVHIRRSDHQLSIKYSKIENFIEAMNKEIIQNINSSFFLATDCKETEEHLCALFPNRIIIYPKASYNRNSKRGVQDALIDLYVLSRTRKVLGSYYSSFSQVAAEISGIEEITVY